MSQNTTRELVAESLARAGLVPGAAQDLIPSDFKPTVSLEVSFVDKVVGLGGVFRANECKITPAIAFKPEADEDSRASYTMIMVDIDASAPGVGFCGLWVLPGLQPLSSSSEHMVAETKHPLLEYRGPGPVENSNSHRCLFLLYREPRNLDMNKGDLQEGGVGQRDDVKLSEFTAKHALVLVGVNWMTCTSG